jgi:hypothetical protein
LAAAVLDPVLLSAAARRLGFDPDDPRRLVDLTAAAVTRIAWRDSPVEDWHAVPHCRIGNGEMMRANAATTRLARDLLDRRSLIALPTAGAQLRYDLFTTLYRAMTDPNRLLPDGRTVAELAPTPAQFADFDKHVCAYCTRWPRVAFEYGMPETLLLFACYAARYCWRWWLAPEWPRVVDEFVRRIDDPARWRDPSMTRQVTRLDRPDEIRDDLRHILLAGPDRLSASAAAYCIRAGLGALLPQDCGVQPLPRHVLPPGYFRLVDRSEADQGRRWRR